MRPYPLVALLGAVAATVIPYQLPAIYPTSTVWKVSVDGKNVPVTSNTNYSYARFAMSGHVNVTIDSLVTSTVDTIRISPKKLGIKPWASGSRVSFTLKDDAYLIVKINSLLEIVIIADALEWKAPRLTDTGVHNVLDAPYQADATGATLTTASFQDAIDNATAQFSSLAGTGASHSIVYVPNGVYTVGNLYLKSNVALYLESSAVLRFSGKHSDYRIDYHKDSQNRDVTWWISTAFNSTNTKIFGRGILDGNGFNSTTTSNPQIGNNILVPIATTGFVADGITALDSGAWSITPIRSKDVTFTNFKFLNRLDMGENDCIDVMESTNVKVSHAIGISLDDPFSTKSWTATNISADIAQNWPGKPQILQDVVVDDTVAWTRTFGYKIGQGVYQPHTDVKFSNGVVYDCSIGLGIDHRYGQAAASRITFENIDIEAVTLMLLNRSSWEAIFIEDPNLTGAGPVTDLLLKNINVMDAGLTGSTLQGWPGFPVQNITFENIRMPNSNAPAKTLDEMNITARDLYDGVKIIA